MRFEVEYFADNYDEPEQYIVKDTKRGHAVAHVFVSDFRNVVPVSEDFIQTRKGLIRAELEALEYASHIAELLDQAVINGELQ